MEDKIVIITGASSGIGLACVRAFCKEKAKVVLAARSIDKLTEIAKELDLTVKSAWQLKLMLL